jgi:serine/threonine protein kinase
MGDVKALSALAALWPRLNALLDQALDLAPAERAAWLEALEGESADLKDTLRRLLEARAKIDADHFLAELPKLQQATGEPSGAHGLSAGALIGPYRLVREVGQGGMGSVWLAERADGAFERRVALKLPLVGRLREHLAARFLRERDILARLEHPHIARLYDAGVDADGLPFLAMEFVEGEPLIAYCDAKRLTVRQRIELLEQVLGAVQYAHAHLIIHRDLKPSNILVDHRGQVRLLDFGIAKLLQDERGEDTALTLLAGHAFTLDYASPEQVRCEPLTVASDVYSLGVVAYELLSGQRPYRLRRGTAADLEVAISEVTPAPASAAATDPALKKALAGDLDAILNQALKKRVAERYATVEALAQDLRRHRQGHAVLARPDTVAYRLRRFCSRYRVAVGTTAVVVVSLATGLTAALWQAHQARRSESAARDALARESAVGSLYIETLSTVAAWPTATFGEKDSVARELKAKLEDFERRSHEQPEMRLALQQNVAVLLPYLGDDAGSLDVARRYLDLLRQTGAGDDRPLEAYLLIGLALKQLGRPSEVEATLRQALAEYPRSAANRGAHASVALELAKLVLGQGRVDEARRMMDDTAAHVDGLVSHKRWEVRHMRGRMLLGYDDLQALRLLREAREDYARDPAAFPINLGMNEVFIGVAALNAGRAADAEVAFRSGRRIFDAGSGLGDRDSVIALSGLMASLSAQGRFDESRAGLVERLTEVDKRPGEYAPEHRSMLNARLLDVAVAHGDMRAASGLLLLEPKDSLRMWRNFELPSYVRAHARALIWVDRADEAARFAAQFIAELPAARHKLPPVLQMRMALAEAELARGRVDAATKLITEMQAAMTREQATRTWLYRESHEWAALAATRGGGSAAEAWSRLETHEKGLGADAPNPPGDAARIDSALRRAELLLAATRKHDALGVLNGVADLLDKQHPDSPRRTAAIRLKASAAE